MAAVARFWRSRNLRESPFFQAALEPGHGEVRYPIDLIVGRREEADRILVGLEAGVDSRSAIQGSPGIGKTTLVQYVKERAATLGIASTERWVPLGSGAGLESVLLQIMGEVYFALLAAGSERISDERPMKVARQLLLAYEVQGGGATLGIATFQAGWNRSETPHTGAGAVLVQVPRLLRDLARVGEERGVTGGILIHLNNLENIAEADAAHAAKVLRDLRDYCLMIPGLHFLVAGTDEAVRQVISAQPQLRSVFGVPEVVEPLDPDLLPELLDRRYEYLKIDSNRPVPPFVTERSLLDLYDLFRGDLRSTLQALEEASKRIAVLGEHPTDPMNEEALRGVLRNVYQRMVRARLESPLLEHAEKATRSFGDDRFTRAELASALGVSARHARDVLTSLRVEGIVQSAGFVEGEGPGRPPEEFVVTGTALLAFDH